MKIKVCTKDLLVFDEREIGDNSDSSKSKDGSFIIGYSYLSIYFATDMKI